MDDKVKKIFQKRLYDLLSHKYGILTIIIGVFLLSISAFHFGEAWLEWSKEKYEVVFHSFSDNIAGKSFRERLSLPVPIDVVYTWVNGTDPDSQRQLEEVKFQLQIKTNLSREVQCSYTNCLPVGIIIHPALLDSVTLSDLQSSVDHGSLFTNVTSMMQMRMGPDVPANVTLLFQEQNVDQLVHHFGKGLVYQGTNYTVQKAYYTSDTTLTHGMAVPLLIMVTGFPSEGYTEDRLKSSLGSQLRVDVTGLDLTVNWDKGLALLQASDKEQFESSVNNKNVTIEGKVLRLAPVTLVWDLLATSPDTEIADYRFQDKEELRYSLRSLDRFAPWIRHIFIVTNGQIPYWLNMDNPRLTVVTHKEIFPNASHLPTFSSPAIEANLHRIPGLSDKFLYLNDDVMFGAPVWPDDFFSYSSGHKVYLAWPVPNCNDGCPSTWINDGYCDKACNSSECDWDGGDCVGDKGRHVQYGAGFHGVQGDYHLENAYCHGGCANSWLADKYCDQSCNTLECGFDAGDCGVDSYNKLYSLDLETKAKNYSLPEGETLAYFNLTDVLGNAGKVTSAKYVSNSAVRAAAVANKFKVLTLILFKGQNKTNVEFDLVYKKDNSTMKINFTVSVDTLKPKMLDQKSEDMNPNATSANNGTITVHKEKTVEEQQDEMDATAFSAPKDNLRQAKIITDKPPLPEKSLDSMDLEFDVLAYHKQLNLSHDLQNQLTILENARDDGDLTQLGLKRKLRNVFFNFKQELATVVPKLKELKTKNESQEVQGTDKNLQGKINPLQTSREKENPVQDIETAKLEMKNKEKSDVPELEKANDKVPVHQSNRDAKMNDGKNKMQVQGNNGHLQNENNNDDEVQDFNNKNKRMDPLPLHLEKSNKNLKMEQKINGVPNSKDNLKENQKKPLNENNLKNKHLKNLNKKKLERKGSKNSPQNLEGNDVGRDDENVDDYKVHGPGRRLLSFLPYLPSSFWKNKFEVAQEMRARRIREMRAREMDDNEYLQMVSIESAGDSVHPLRWEDKVEVRQDQDITQEERDKKDKVNSAYIVDGWQGRQLLDAFGDSLRHVNRLYNKEFGFTARKALAHMPHMIDKNIMYEMQERFHDEWEATSSHKIRHPKDMQFAFAYFYYVMGVTEPVSPSWVFDDLDTDKSGILSDRELRTLATKLYELPLYLEVLTGLESMLINCSNHLHEKQEGMVTTSLTSQTEQKELEVYYDKNMPQVTKELFLSCGSLLELVKKHFKPQFKYKTTVMDDSDVAFKIIHSNVSKVVGKLDDIRKNPKKFICLNDNMDHSLEEAKTVTAVLQDFYESVLPIPSQFELSRDYRNRFLHMDQLREWRAYRDWLQFWTHVALGILILFTVMSFLGDKIENMTRKISRRLRRRSTSPSSSSSSSCSSSSTSSLPPSPSSSMTELPNLNSPGEASVFLSGVETV